MNFMLARIQGDDVQVGETKLDVPAPPGTRGEVIVGIRPEGLVLDGPQTTFEGQVRAVELLGNEAIVHFDVPGDAPVLPELSEVAVTNETLGPAPGVVRVTARVPTGTALPAGGAAPLSVRAEAVHFFDAATHMALPVKHGAGTASTPRPLER